MIEFNVSVAIDPSPAEDPDHDATYVIHAGGHDIYRVLLHRDSGTIRPSRFESLVPRCPAFDIEQTEWVGRRKIAVRNATSGARIGEIRGRNLFFDAPNQVVGLHDPALPLKRMLRRALHARPNRFIFRRAFDRSTIGGIEAPPSAQGPWPLRMVKALGLDPTAQFPMVWQGRLDCAGLDFRMFAAMAVVLHGDRGDGSV